MIRSAWFLAALTLPLCAADHGPVFGLGTPTNPKGGWSFNLGFNRRGGSGMMQAQLSYGLTQNLKLTFSAPLDVLRIPTSGETIELAEDSNLSDQLAKRVGESITIHAKAAWAKNGKPSPLAIAELK